jgi:hypothetical protein
LAPENQTATAPTRNPITSATNSAMKPGNVACQGSGHRLMVMEAPLSMAKTTRMAARISPKM